MAVVLPPSYESLAKEVRALGLHASIKEAKPLLDKIEDAILNSDFGRPQGKEGKAPGKEANDEEVRKLEMQLADFMSTETGVEVIKHAANEAGKKLRVMSEMVQSIALELAAVYDKDPSAYFADQFKDFATNYYKVIADSQVVATEIATYGTSYHHIVKKVMKDDTASKEEKIKFLEDFILEEEAFEKKSVAMNDAMSQLIVNFTPFVENFRQWGANKEPFTELGEKIEALQKEIAALSAEAAQLRQEGQDTVKWVLGRCLCGGMLLMFSPAALSFLMIGAGISPETGWAHALSKSHAAQDKDQQRETKKAELDALKTAYKNLKDTSKHLADLLDSDLMILKGGVDVLRQIWKGVHSDVTTVLEELKAGKVGDNASPAVQMALDESNKNYIVMSEYLTQYALGLKGTDIEAEIE